MALVATAIFAVLVGGLVPTASMAAVGDAELSLQKSVVGQPITPTYRPGDTFQYQLVVSCASLDAAGCINAAVTDALPSPLVFDTPAVASVTGVGARYTASEANNSVTVAFIQPLDGTDVGLEAGTSDVTIILNVRVPTTLTVQDAGEITNTANATASNALTVPASTLVNIQVDQTLSAAASKTAQSNMPAGQPIPAVPGRAVGWTIGGANTSNTTVDSLTIQDPGDTASDPFQLLALTGISSLRPPAGADTVDVFWRDAGGTWASVAGPVTIPADPNDLLTGLTLPDVHGLRFVFTNSAGDIGIQPIASGASIQLATVTRPSVVDIPDGSTVTVTDTAQVQVSNAGAASPNANASASGRIRRIKPTVAITKVWDRPTVVSGETRTATIGASVGEAPVARMVIAEPGAGGLTLQQQGLDFVGWTTADLEWPVGATGAAIAYAYADGAGTPQSTSTRDTLPAPEAGRTVDGFTVEFTGLMNAAQFATLPFVVRAQPVTGQADVRSLNSASAQVFDELGQQSDVGFSEAALTRQPLRITASIDKDISRDWIWSAGGATSLVQLPAAVSIAGADASTVGSQSLVVSDPGNPVAGDPPTDFWDHFDLQQIVTTEVPAGSQLTITYWNGSAWVNLPGGAGVDIPGPSSSFTYTPSAALREQIQGIRYSFTPLPAGGLLPPGFNVLPYYRVELRDSLRSDPGVDLNGASGVVSNDAAATAVNPNASPGTSTATDTDSIELRAVPDGPGGLGPLVSKGWLLNGAPSDDATTTAQTDAQSSLRITWGTNEFPFDAMTITDPATDPANVAGSVYDAFDLVRIQPITSATDPLMTFDAVSSVALYSSTTGGWVDITSTVCGPTGALCDGRFPGYTLTTAQQASTLAVRLVLVESPTRASRATAPTDPAAGSGVAGSSVVRPLDLTYQLRQDRRSDPLQPVLGTANGYTYNSGLPGVVENTASVVGVDPDLTYTSTDGSPITILDSPLNVTVTKAFDQTDVGIPPSDTDPALFPLVTGTITATNTSAGKIRSLTISDPARTQAAPTIYETMNLYQIAGITVPAGATASVVTLSRGAVQTTYTIGQALALTGAQLADVTAVSVEHTGFVASQGSSTLTLVYQERPLTRSGNAAITPGLIGLNVAQALITSPGGTPGNVPVATASDDIVFVLPSYSVSATKSFNATSRYEDQSNAYVVTLRSRPAGTARTTTLTFEDSTPTFWNAFSFTSFPSTTLPAPVRRMKVDALVGVAYALDGENLIATCGGSTDLTACWRNGVYVNANATSGAVTPVLPSGVTAAQVRGLRYSFQTATGDNWERPYNPEVVVSMNVTRNATLRYGIGGSTTQPVPSTQPGVLPAPGEPVQGTTTDTLDVDAVASWRNGPSLWEAEASSTATTALLHRATALRILKTPTGPQSPENDIDFTITVTNTGARAISNLILTDLSSTDAQGAMLRPADRDAGDTTPIFSFGLVGANGQAKPVTGFSASFSTTTGRLTINVPTGFVFAVGDVLTIFADMAFRVGLEPETPVLNTVTATADRILDSCVGSVNTVPQSALTNVPSCVASTQVSPTPAAPLRITKWVKGVGAGIPGADPADPNYNDLGTLAFNVPTNQCLTANGVDGYWRTPCIPITRPGGTETWKIEVTNLGNIPATVISGIDVLPAYGDTGVIINSPRQSAWPVTFAGNVQYLSGLTTGEQRRAYYMTTVPNTACNAADILRDTSGTILPSNPCYADVTTRNWIPLDTITPAQFPSVRALKVVVDFANRATQGLPPGESLRVTYDTTTAWQPVRAETQDRDAIAWNSVAVGARGVLNDLNYTTTVVEPRKIGVAMATGKIDLAKAVDLPEGWNPAITMPTSYAFDVSCTSGPQQVSLVNTTGAPMSRVTVAANGTVLHYADGANPATSAWSNVNLPLYAECSITEAAPPPGVLISYSPQPVTALRDWSNRTNVVNAAYPDPIELNRITATNTYQLAGFTVEKAVDNGPAVDQDGNPIQYVDDYAFTASCRYLGQEVIPVAQRSFVLDDGEVIEFTGLPAGSSCRVTETNARGAALTYTQVSVSGLPGPNDPDPIADFELVANLPDSTAPRTAVTVTNVYTAGSASITKAIAGTGGSAWGDGDFTVGLRCTLAWGDPQLVFQSTRTLNRADPTWNIANLARGAVCTVSETANGGANSTTITPTTFTVTDAAAPAIATVTNTFTTGSLSVRKALSGSPAATLAPATQGSYVVSLACTRIVNGQTVSIAIPGGATRTIIGAGTATYTGLPTGAVCTVTEPDQGFAGSHTVAPASLTIGNGTTVAATVTNVFPNGSLALTKVVSGPGASDAPTTFGATVTCLWHGATVPLAAGGRVTLRPSATTTITGIPVDSICSIVEDDAGQDETIYTPATAVIAASGSPVATIQTENVYLRASLRVAKNVDPNEGAVPTGFGMSVECTFRGATVLPLTSFTLDGGQYRDFTGLPSRSRCVIIETDNRGAAATVSQVVVESATVAPIVTQSSRTVIIPELSRDLVAGEPRNRVTFTNLFDVSGLLIEKDFAGTAADQVGLGQSFTIDVECINAGEIVLDDQPVLSPENGYTFAFFPIAAQTRCEITETDGAFADAVVITPNEGDPTTGVIIIPTEGLGSVAVTNWYLGGSLEITKVLAGDAAEKFGTGDFEVTLTCTLRGDDLEIADGPARTISAASPTATFTALPTGAECRVVETDTGGATHHWLADADGVPLEVDEEGGYTFTIETDAAHLTETDQPQTPVTAVNEFLFAAVSASKVVRTFSGGVPENAPATFPIEVTCALDGLPVAALEDALQFVAVGGTATWTELPVGAECEITETNAGDAIVTTVAVDDGAPVDGRTTTVVLAEGSAAEPSVAAFVNTFSDPLPVTGAPVPWTGILLGGGMLLLGLVLVLLRRRRA